MLIGRSCKVLTMEKIQTQNLLVSRVQIIKFLLKKQGQDSQSFLNIVFKADVIKC